MLGGVYDEQFLDVYRRSHDPPEGGGRGACLRDAGRRPWRCRARRRRRGRWTVGSHRDQGRQAGDRLDERAAHDPLTVLPFLNPRTLRAFGRAFFWAAPGRPARAAQCGSRDTLGKNFRHGDRRAAHSSNWDSGGAGLRGAAVDGNGTPIWRISSTGCSIGGTRSGANLHAASSAATAATTSVIRIANARHRRISRWTAAVAGSTDGMRVSLGVSSAAAAGGATGVGDAGSTAAVCAGAGAGASEIDADVGSKAGAEVASKAGGDVASEAGAGVTSKGGGDVASEAGAGVASEAGGDVASEAGPGVAFEAGASVASNAGASVASEAGAGIASEAGAGVACEAGICIPSGIGDGAGSVALAEFASEVSVVVACDIAASIASRLGGSLAVGAGAGGATSGAGGCIFCRTSGIFALMRVQIAASGSTGSTMRCSSPNRRSHSSTLAANAWSASNKVRACMRSSKSSVPSTYPAASASV